MIEYQIYGLDGMAVNEAVTENEDGSYTIFVNNELCQAKRLLAIEHAFRHIMGDDFSKADVQEIEEEAHLQCI
ncbi:MAG: hypothetical protein LUD72_06715 [Bacteroidales bacterium]|nr:hypothetical protein [Bacteroidales bacterium]